MKSAELGFKIALDNEGIPENIQWSATDSQEEAISVKAMAVSVWDAMTKNTLKVDLWVKDMDVYEMKHFYIEAISGFAETLKKATGDTIMTDKIINLCNELVGDLAKEMKVENTPLA